SSVKRSKERSLEEAAQLLRQIPEAQLRGLEEEHLLLLVRLLLSLQLEMVSISTACRKVDQMLQHLAAKVDHKLVLSLEDLQRCMYLEDSIVGREVWQESFVPMLQRVSESLPAVLQEESRRDGPICYVSVKWLQVCLQAFQLLPNEVAPLVWEENHSKEAVQRILQALIDILGQCCNRDTRLLAGTAVAMLINTASESTAAGAAAWNLLQPCQLTVGVLQVTCDHVGKDRVDRLAVSRGLLTCCRPHVLLSPSHDTTQACLLLDGLFPLVYALCEEKQDCHYFAFELTMWLRRAKECVTDLWRMTGSRLLPDDSRLLQRLTHIIWTGAESPVLDQYTEVSRHLLKCLSTNHLSPCGSEFYKRLIQQQRRELPASLAEVDLAGRWADSWQPLLLEALTSEVTLLQTNASTHLLPCTLQVFPSAVHHLLASLEPHEPGHLRAWACLLSSYRAISGCSPWALQGSSTFKTLQLALGSADDKVRLAALNLLCCSPKTRDVPSAEEITILKEFVPQNLNCESSPFRQHLQAAVRRFLVRVRDGTLAHVRGVKGKKKEDVSHESRKDVLEQGIFVEWLGELPYGSLSPGHSYQRKKTALLLLSAVLETCTDTWSPDKKKGQPPNVGLLIDCARQRGQWDFFCRTKQLLLISCLEDSTNEIRELSAGLLLRFFPPTFPADIAEVLETRSMQLLRSPRVQEAQMGALMMKMLLQLCALQRCLLEAADDIYATLDRSLMTKLLDLLENISLLLLAVLHGDREARVSETAPPSFCDMGNAISSLISQQSGGGPTDEEEEEEECVLLSEEHSLVLTCCWVSLKETGIFLGSLVEKVLKESKKHSECLLTKRDLVRASDIFKDILLKCRHWGAVEGCGLGFTKFCTSLLNSSDPDLKDIPAQMGLQVVQCAGSTSVTRRAAGLPMLILCVLSSEEVSKARPLLALSVQTLLDTARRPLDENWDQTLDLPQVCAVHTLQALVRGSGLGAAVLQFAPAVAVLSLTLLRSPCWAMRNAALQLYSLCSRMLGQRSGSVEAGPTQHSMSPAAFFFHYPTLQAFLLGELRGAAQQLQRPTAGAKLHLQPSLYPILTLLAQLQPGVQTLLDFLPPLLQLSASPIYSVRVMVSKALVAMTPPSGYFDLLLKLTSQLPGPQESCSHNRLHGQLLQMKALLDRALCSDLQVGLSSFHQRALHFLCADPKWACQTWESFSAASPELRLSLVAWLLDSQDWQQIDLKEVIQRQSNLKEALLGDSVDYRTTYLTALVSVMAGGGSALPQPLPDSEPCSSECLHLLLQDLEIQKGGPEYLSQALHAASLLLSLINTGLYLLQDQSQEVRQKAARFASLLHHSRRGNDQRSVCIMQINQALLLLLDLLLQESWDTPGALEVLLSHLPQADLRSVLRERSCSLYEQDEANVFAEPSVMSAHLLPYLLQMAEKSSQSSALAQTLTAWAEKNTAQVLDNLTDCEQLQPETLTPSWLALLVDPRFHFALWGLFARAVFLLHLLKTSACPQRHCDPL
uniref:Si:ch211-225b11.4 n=1 Tax=Poecilia latipinna TaxID=48699 RepID=A0A3B3TNA3_9TELE